ncbi:hypothetical protein HPC49_23010 [Pyxidicoccus fallax]|uniref:MYXO-CTERM domain-containing protein n=1 Tax=Pyxidicoccus fallax TaxID=394095 RepID=A0A848LR03_9BACT|nr:MXAN_5453 family MXYO-CTERM-anchored protein [Pyxidicoccus fallax]NMO20327.1 hypothetical protein [Pyxidicoccus fallax]NPC81083.1 hypothetical protein [Pyxidicoccus fallax]
MSNALPRCSARTIPGQAVMLGALAMATPAWAELPDYTYQLQARTNLRGNLSGAYNLDPGNLLAASLQVPLTWDRQLAFRLQITPEGPNALWWGGGGMGSRVYLLPRELGEDARASDPGLNSMGDLAFAVTGASSASGNGIYLLNVSAPDQVRIIREPLGASDWSSLWLNEAGQLGARVTFSGVGKAYALLTPTPDGTGFVSTLVAKENALDPSSRFTFLYSPTLNDLGQMAGVADTATAEAEWFQELRVFSANPNGTSRIIARSRGLEASSPIYRFASVQPALNNRGEVAFLGTSRDASNRNITTLWLWTGTELKVLAQNGVNGIREMEFFPPDINDQGRVVFRAIDSNGRRAVWVTDGQDMKRVVSEHDIVPSDLGPARIDQETPSNPVFAGGPLINARGDITFVAGLAPPEDDQEEWGTAIFVAMAEEDGGTDGGTGGPDAGTDGGPGEPDAGADGGTGDPDAGVDGGSGQPDSGADAGPGEPDAGVDGGTDGGPGEPDAGAAPDAGPGENPDAGQEPDAGTGPVPDAGNPGGNPGNDPGGCGCQSTQASAVMPWLLLGLARFATSRRRKDARHG